MLAVPWHSHQLERLNNMLVMGSITEWTVPPKQGLTIRLRGNDLSLESLYIEEEDVDSRTMRSSRSI